MLRARADATETAHHDRHGIAASSIEPVPRVPGAGGGGHDHRHHLRGFLQAAAPGTLSSRRTY